MVFKSRLFHVDPDLDGRRGPYYRKPGQYLAVAMAVAKYDKWEVEVAVKKLEAHKGTKLADSIALECMKSVQYPQLIASLRSFFHASHKRTKRN